MLVLELLGEAEGGGKAVVGGALIVCSLTFVGQGPEKARGSDGGGTGRNTHSAQSGMSGSLHSRQQPTDEFPLPSPPPADLRDYASRKSRGRRCALNAHDRGQESENKRKEIQGTKQSQGRQLFATAGSSQCTEPLVCQPIRQVCVFLQQMVVGRRK